MPLFPTAERRPVGAVLITLALSLSTLPTGALRAQTEVDLALVLAVDASDSIGGEMLAMQRRGHVEALKHPAITAAITHGRHGRIAVAYVEWSGREWQRLVVPFTIISSAEEAAAFSRRIETDLRPARGTTAIGAALVFAGALLARSDIRAERQVIDLSANGNWNDGVAPSVVRDALVEAGVTINGLPIVGSFGSTYFGDDYDHILEKHFNDCVVGGEGAFWLSVRESSDFTVTLIRKMTLEITGRRPIQPLRPIRVSSSPRC